MRRIELVSLRLRNFAGAQAVRLDLDGRSAAIFGRNASGKTTTFSAWTWLLFEKNSVGAKTFEIKTLDARGVAASGLEHEVEGVLRVDGELVTLRRVYKETWTKKRGSATAELTGHETEHFWDGVPMSKTEYTARVAEIADEKTWRLLSDPGAFQALHWQERRRVLLEVCGDVSDSDVIAGNEELADLPGILGKRTLEEHRKVIASRRPQLNRELQELPARIDEVRRGLPEAPEMARALVEQGLAGARRRQAEALEALAVARAGQADVSAERARLRVVEDALTDLERAARRKAEEAGEAAAARVQAAQRAVVEAEERIASWRRQIIERGEDLARLEERLTELRARWSAVKARRIEVHADDTCPACKQALPPEQVAEAHARAEAELNARKARELAAVDDEGKALRGKRDSVAAEIELLRDKISRQEAGLEQLQAAAEATTAKLLPSEDVTRSRAYTQLAMERDDLTRRVQELTAGDPAALAALEVAVVEGRQAVALLEQDLAAHEARARGEARLGELRDQERLLAREFEELERQQHLMELFVRTKVELLERHVADKFRLVRFRLFRSQVNGGIEEVCDATVAGVPFESVNHAGRIAAGLDIIRSLQEHYGLSAPVWIDQAESIHDIPVTGAQQIALVVNPNDKQLRVELRKEAEVAA